MKVVGPLQMQEKTQIAIGTATGNAGQFYQRIQNSSKHVLMYEDKDLQRYALSKIPKCLNECVLLSLSPRRQIDCH